MHISVNKFSSLKKVDFDVNPGISVIAGTNGSGKSQLLMAIAHQYGNLTIRKDIYSDLSIKSVQIDPKPNKALYRPPVRNYVNKSSKKYATISPPDYKREGDNYQGYTFNVDARFYSLHADLSRLFVSSQVSKDKTNPMEHSWYKIQSSFSRVFDKKLDCEFDDKYGARIGLVLSDSHLTSFHSLSTGELEFLSLIYDLVTEPEVDLFLIDEIDAHFHPDLQSKLIDSISDLIQDKYLILTTHSPSIMLSVNSENVYYLHKWEDLENKTDNQIVRLSDNYEVLEAISRLYVGFVTDLRFSSLVQDAASHELYKYAHECLQPSQVIGGSEERSFDPQQSLLRGMILNVSSDTTILDFGCGKGRLLSGFSNIDDTILENLTYICYDKVLQTTEIKQIIDDKEFNKKFKQDVIITDEIEKCNFDICIMANVLHEINPDTISSTFNKLFEIANPGAKILILEALELDLGEANFVVFDVEAIKELLNRKTDGLTICRSEATSHSGTPLMELLISMKNDGIIIDNKDVIRALDVIIKNSSSKISDHIKNSKLEPRKYAFHCHNLAHAVAYKETLSSI